jgi:pimeloyl-ACP methyl ester carboxylesterase
MKLYFRKIGTGTPLLILHGLFGQSDNWLTIGKQLANQFCVYLLDLRNHGRSPHSDTFNLSVMIEDIYEFLTDFSLKQVSLIGHSMGGLTAMNFASEYHHRVDKLVIIDIAPRSYSVLHQDIIDGLLSVDLDKINSRKEADSQLVQFVQSSVVRKFLLKNLYKDEYRGWSWRLNLPVIDQKRSEIGKGLIKPVIFEKPALFIRGELSTYVTREDISLIKELYPKAIIETIPGTTHWLHSESPDELLSCIIPFLSNSKGS